MPKRSNRRREPNLKEKIFVSWSKSDLELSWTLFGYLGAVLVGQLYSKILRMLRRMKFAVRNTARSTPNILRESNRRRLQWKGAARSLVNVTIFRTFLNNVQGNGPNDALVLPRILKMLQIGIVYWCISFHTAIILSQLVACCTMSSSRSRSAGCRQCSRTLHTACCGPCTTLTSKIE